MKSKHIVVDIEANGPIIGQHSCTEFGMVIVEEGLSRTFHGRMRPLNDDYVPEALAVSGRTHAETQKFEPPESIMRRAAAWIHENIEGKPIFWSDNNGFDFAWMHWYFLKFNGGVDPFGYSSRRIADLICGIENDLRFRWKDKRETKHSHHPVDDATGNAEVLLLYLNKYNIKY